MQGHKKKTNKAQTIKGNWQRQAGSLVTYQCGEAVADGSNQMPNPKCRRQIIVPKDTAIATK